MAEFRITDPGESFCSMIAVLKVPTVEIA